MNFREDVNRARNAIILTCEIKLNSDNDIDESNIEHLEKQVLNDPHAPIIIVNPSENEGKVCYQLGEVDARNEDMIANYQSQTESINLESTVVSERIDLLHS